MKKMWNELMQYTSKEQTFLIVLYLSFAAYLKNMQTENWTKRTEINTISNFKNLSKMFGSESDDQLKKAASNLEESIIWEVFMGWDLGERILKNIQDTLETWIQSKYDLEKMMMDLANLVPEDFGTQITPVSVNQLMAALSSNKNTVSIVELFCGLSGTGIAVWEELVKQNADAHLTGIELKQLYCDISRLRMFCHEMQYPKMIQKDILKEEGKQSYDLVVADLPKGRNESVYIRNQETFLGDKNTVFTEWVAIQRVLSWVNESGKAMLIVTKGALVRQRERSIRKILTQKDWLEAVITLPSNLYTGTAIGFELLIFNKCKSKKNQNNVFMADISKEKQVCNGVCEISEEGIEKLKKSYENWETHSLFSMVVSIEEIEKEEFSWNPFLYLHRNKQTGEERKRIELGEVAEIMRGVQISKEEEKELSYKATHYWLNIRNIEDNKILFDTNSMLQAKSSNWEDKFGIMEEDIILTSKGAVLKLCMVESGMPKAFLCGNLTRIRVNKEKYSPYILFEFLNSEEGREVLESIQSGTTIKVLNNANLKKMLIPDYKNVKEKGEELKAVYQEYQKAEREIRNRFETQRKQLLEQLQ